MAVSVAISLVFSTTALWFTLAARKGVHFLAAALVMALAVTGTHYSAMVALGVDMSPMPHDVPGVEPTLFVLPILLLSIATLICLLFCGLNILGDEQFALRVDPAILAAPPSQSSTRPRGRTASQAVRTSRPASHIGDPPPIGGYPSPRSGFEPAIGAGPTAGASPYRPDRMRPSSLRALAGNTSELRVVGRDRDGLRRAPSDRVPSDRAPSDRVPSDRAPSDRVPIDRAPSDRVPIDRAPSDRVPIDRAPSDRVPIDRAPSDEPPGVVSRAELPGDDD
jgi:hypothetical protein